MKITLGVKKMHCKSCEMLLEDALKEQDGVKEAKFFHKEGKAQIEFDDDKISKEKIIGIIKKEGYEA